MRVELGSHEIVVEPENGIALFGTPLVVAEYDHGDAGPPLAPDRAHLAHGNSESSVAGKADARRARIADLGADDRREAIAARTEQAGGQIFTWLIEDNGCPDAARLLCGPSYTRAR